MFFSPLRSKLFLPVALTAAAGVPYVGMNPELREQVQTKFASLSSTEEAPSADESEQLQAAVPQPDQSQHNIREHVNSPETSLLFTPTVHDMRDVFRFDVTPNWVKSRWPRVSTSIYEDELEGLRVPLVTGTHAWDVHGSLTFFFDTRHRVQRIKFFGYTGDATRLVQTLTPLFGLRAVPTRTAGLYVRSYHGRPVNALRLVHAPVIRADQPQQHMQVEIELNNPQGSFQISRRFGSQLEQDRLAGRWSDR